jgi:hypothetical protein
MPSRDGKIPTFDSTGPNHPKSANLVISHRVMGGYAGGNILKPMIMIDSAPGPS